MKSQKRERRFTSDRDLGPIQPPSEAALDELYKKHKISNEKREHLRQSLYLLASAAETMRRDQKQQEKPASQAKEFRKYAIRMRHAAVWMDQFDTIFPLKMKFEIIDPVGLNALGMFAATNLGDVLNSDLVVHPREKAKISSSHNGPIALTQGEIERRIIANPGMVMRDLLLRLATIFAMTANQIEAETSAGPKPLLILPMMIQNLASEYHLLGRKPSEGRTGPFQRFVEEILISMGLDAELAQGHIAKAVRGWKSWHITPT